MFTPEYSGTKAEIPVSLDLAVRTKKNGTIGWLKMLVLRLMSYASTRPDLSYPGEGLREYHAMELLSVLDRTMSS